ncbi:thiamine pyrophosphate-binding protein [Rhodobacterales bacterium HKCCE2091]|nr:thiamine pyrophosphate-binding protein [Rhodobacterales bacterium HKCCE2091]
MRVYEALAQCFAAEDVTVQFGLMGDGNMHFMAAMDALPGMRSVGARHEHCALLMAVGYWNATGRPGVCSVTHGPGFTQLMTGLATAARNRAPVVVVTGETGIGAAWNVQQLDQAPLARACGAEYLQVHSYKVLHHRVREAFYIARTERKPVVIGVPLDLMKSVAPERPDYDPSLAHLPPAAPLPPDPGAIAELARRLATARAPLLVAGRGAIHAGAAGAIERLADETGALLGTSLLGKGMFEDHPYSLGIVGGYISEAGRDAVASTDLVIAFGAQLSRFTLDGGKLFAGAEIMQVDVAPNPLNEGLVSAHRVIRADARLAAEALLDAVRDLPDRTVPAIRTDALARTLRQAPADSAPFDPPPGLADPRRVFEALERVLPADYHLVSGAAHQAYWHTAMRGIAGGNYHAIRAFGAIGNSLSFATGIAVATGDGKVILSDGDGGLLMHIQELETIAREGIRLLVICINDGAYGAEIHKLRADDVDDSGAVFGETGLASVATAFGLGSATITDPSQVADAFAQYAADDRAWLWDVKVSDLQQSPPMRANLAAKG